jgi:glycosyltransferase involved in cell wall biosynthesis
VRVLVVSRWYPGPEDPHAGVFVQDYVRALEPACDVQVVVPRPAPAAAVLRFLAGRFTAVGRETRVPVPRGHFGLVPRWLVFERVLGGFEPRPDVVHLHVLLPDVLSALVAAHRRGIPLVASEHVGYLSELARSRRGRIQLVQGLRRADAVLATSGQLAEELRRYERCARIHVVGNPVDTELFRPEPGAPRTFALSACLTLGEAKGTDVLLQAWARARRQTELPPLVVVGGGPDRGRFADLARALDVADACEFVGRKSRAELAALMRRAAFFVSASRSERFSLVVAEAIASGASVVSTRVGGPDEYVTPDVGVLVEPGDVDSLAAGIAGLAGRAASFDAGALHAHVARRFGYAAVRERLLSVYASLLPRPVTRI